MTAIQQALLTASQPPQVVDPPNSVFVERFEGGLGNWNVIAGNPTIWSTTPGPFGQALITPGQTPADPTPARLRRSAAGAVTANVVEWKVRILPGAYFDDAPILNLRYQGLDQIVVFNPRREYAIDPAQLARVGINGTTYFTLPAILPSGVWFRFKLYIGVVPNEVKLEQFDAITNVLLNTYTNTAPVTGITLDEVEIFVDSPLLVTTGGAEYDDILCYVEGGV